MRHSLHKRGDIGAELVAIALADFAAARSLLHARRPLNERIHRVRQHLKWVRSVLRILEPAVGERAARLRRDVAATAKLLAQARDARVAAVSARVISATAAGDEAAGFAQVADALDREVAAAHRERVPLAAVDRELARISRAVARFGAIEDGGALLSAALARAYRRGRRAKEDAERTSATADFHRWRQRTKHLAHVIRLARKLLPARMGALAPRLDALADLLGLDHDHAMLADKIALSSQDRAVPQQLAVIARRRRAMEREALELGDAIYARKPKAFSRRVYLKGEDV
jgi:CHAD domain-containing protein